MNAQQRDKLIWNAIPTIFQVPNPPKLIDGGRKPPMNRMARLPVIQLSKRSKIEGDHIYYYCSKTRATLNL